MMSLERNRSGKPHKRERRDGWTAKKREVFLDVLAATCNVSRAAGAVGMSTTGLYQLRLRDGGFAALWAEALELGYQRLEDELLARALGTGGSDPAVELRNPEGERADPVPELVGPFDPDLAMRILKLRASIGPGRPGRARAKPSQAEVDAELMRRLDALAESLKRKEERERAEAAGVGEAVGTDGETDR
jgi:hypothetical protein